MRTRSAAEDRKASVPGYKDRGPLITFSAAAMEESKKAGESEVLTRYFEIQRNNSVWIGGQGKFEYSSSLDNRIDSTAFFESDEVVDQSITPLMRFRVYNN